MDQQMNVENPWRLVDAAVMGPHVDPEQLAQSLRELNVVAEVLWNPITTTAAGMVLLVNEAARVASLSGNSLEYQEGKTLGEVGDQIAKRLGALVTIKHESWDHTPENAQWPETEMEELAITRTVEITPMSAASVPFVAAVEGIDMGCIEIDEDHRAVMYEEPTRLFAEKELLCEAPGIAFSAGRDDIFMVVLTDDSGSDEAAIVHSFSMKTQIISGQAKLSPEDHERLRADMGRGLLAGRIAEMVPGANVDELAEGLRERGSAGMRRVLRALQLPRDVEAFLLEHRALADVERINLHEARGLANAIGRSVDIMLTQPEAAGSPLWTTYHKVAVEKPWIARSIAAVEASVGATLVTLAYKAKSPRSGLLKLGGIVGAILVVDSIAEVSLAKYLGHRARENETETVNEEE